MTNLALEHALAKLDIPFARANVGDRYVLEMMLERGWQLGGENSGHIVCLDRHSTGDGIVSALQVVSALRERACSLAELLGGLTLYPQVLINVPVFPGFGWRDNSRIQAAQAEVELQLVGRGRVLLRASGTEPVLRVMVEADDRELAERSAAQLAGAVRDAVEATVA
jgi:phosphoglucosamine mutase